MTHAGDGSNRLFVVEQAGVVRIVDSGVVLPTPFLDLRALVASGGERGLLGIVFHPDYELNGFFFVDYTDLGGNTVIARYSVSADPNVADPMSAVTLLNIAQPFANHNGGGLQFGPNDGYLYIGMGDGGSGNDPLGHGQNEDTLLGSLLRLDVDAGFPYAVPVDNPFVGISGADEIWAIGLRNPWRISFDRDTGDLLIGDVGQAAWEEIDFQRAGTPGGVNFGWGIREGPCPRGDVFPCPPAPAGLTDPIAYYGRTEGRSVTGGFVYRGAAFPSLFGHYLYADFVTGRIWSLSKTSATSWSAPRLEAIAGFNVSSFGEDEAGELYIVDYSGGTIRRLEDDGAPRPSTTLLAVDSPSEGDQVPASFTISGWAIDPSASTGSGVSQIEIWATPQGGSAVMLGLASYGGSRPDVGAYFGDSRFDDSGFTFDVPSLPSGNYTVRVRARSSVRDELDQERALALRVGSDPRMGLESPVAGTTVSVPFTVKGWAIDRFASGGPGVDEVQVWIVPSGGAEIFLGNATYGLSRPDVAAFFGNSSFSPSGFSFPVQTFLAEGDYAIEVRARSTVTGSFDNVRSVAVSVTGQDFLVVDKPSSGSAVGGPFTVRGWALNTGAAVGTGMDAVHVLAIANGSGAATFLGAATLGVSRPDVGAFFGEPRFADSGFSLTAPRLAPGSYTIRVYAHNAARGTFSIWRDVLVQAVGSLPRVAVDRPRAGGVASSFQVSGWAVDANASMGTGVDAVHVWATPLAGGAQIFLGAATTGISRPDVAAFFGNPNFVGAGYELTTSSLTSGSYILVVWMRSTVSGAFTNAAPVLISVP